MRGVRPISPVADQQDLVLQSAGLDVCNKRRHRMIEGPPDRLHAIDHVEIVVVGVEIPDAFVVGVNGDEAAARLAQPACQQQQLAERLRLAGVIARPAPGRTAPVIRRA